MKLKVAAPTLNTGRKRNENRHEGSLSQETGGGHSHMTKTSSSSKLKALVKNGKNKALKMKHESTKVLIKVLPKSAVPTNGQKRDYDTDSSSQDHLPLLPDYEGSTDEESHNAGEGEYMAQFSPIPDHELPIATPVTVDEPPTAPSPKHRRPQVQQAPRQKPVTRKAPIIKVNVNTHRSRAFYAASKNTDKTTEATPKEELFAKFPDLTCQMPQFPSDVSGVSDNAVQPAQDPMDDMKLVSKAALFKALQVSGAVIDQGNTLCATTYEKSLKGGAVPCITKAPASIEGANLEIVSETSICSIAPQPQEQVDYPDDESSPPVKREPRQVFEKKKSRRHRRRNKKKYLQKEEVADPDAQTVVKVDDSDDFFLMTAEDIQEIRKMARGLVDETTSAHGRESGIFSCHQVKEAGIFGCHQVQDAVEWLLCTSIQGGGRQTMTKKQARTYFADRDMQDGGSPPFAGTKFVDDDMTFSSKGSIDESYTMEHGDNSVVQENDDEDSDEDSDDGGDFYFDEQSITTAKKVVRQFRPTGLICTEDLTVVYGGNLEQLEDTIETVLIVDDKKYNSESNDKRVERVDCEYGFEPLLNTQDSIPNFDESKFNYNYENYQVKIGAAGRNVEGPMNMDAIVCENNEDDDECWENLSIITPHSAHTATFRRLQELETELARLQKEYQEISDYNEDPAVEQPTTSLNDEAKMEQVQSEPCDDSSIDGPMHPLDETNNGAPQSGGADDRSLRSAEVQNKLAAINVLQEEKNILEKRVQELVTMMEASELCHSSQMAETKKASQAKMEELKYQQKDALEEAATKIEELESNLRNSQTNMADIRAKYSRDLEAAKLLQSNDLQEIQNQQRTSLDVATSKIEELESNLENTQMALEELKKKHSRDLEAAERAQMYKVRERELRESDLRSSLEDAQYQSQKDREESDRKVREIREEHTKQIEEMIRQLDVVVGEHEKQHVKEYEKLITQLDLVVAEHEAKCDEMNKLAMEKDGLIANLGSQLAEAQRRLNRIGEKSS